MIESSIVKMSNESYVVQIQGLDESLEILEKLSTEMIKVLKKSEDSLFVAERISNFFGILLQKLDRAFDETNNLQLKLNIAIIYLTNDINTKNDFLLQYAKETESVGDATFCIMKLSQKGVGGTESLIKTWIDKIINSKVSINEEKKADYLEMLQDAYNRCSR